MNTPEDSTTLFQRETTFVRQEVMFIVYVHEIFQTSNFVSRKNILPEKVVSL